MQHGRAKHSIEYYPCCCLSLQYQVAVRVLSSGTYHYRLSCACDAVTTSSESWNMCQLIPAVGTNVYHVLAVRDAERNEATSEQNDPENIIKHTCSFSHIMYTTLELQHGCGSGVQVCSVEKTPSACTRPPESTSKVKTRSI